MTPERLSHIKTQTTMQFTDTLTMRNDSSSHPQNIIIAAVKYLILGGKCIMCVKLEADAEDEQIQLIFTC